MRRALGIACSLAVLAAPPAVGIANSARWNAAAVPVGGIDVELQRDPLGCGPAVIATLARLQGRSLTEAAVLAVADLGENGVTLAEFARLAAKFGLPGTWLQVGQRDLAHLATPFVAHLERPDGGHFVAVLGSRHGFAVVADPALGASVGPASTTLAGFSGRVFLLRERQ